MCLIVPGNTDKGLGRKLCPGMWLAFKSHLSLSHSHSHSISRLLPPSHSLESSSAKVICAGPGWQISARRAVKFFNLDCPSVFQTPINYKFFLQEITPLLVWRYFTLHRAPIPYHSQPFTLTDNHPIATAFYMITHLTPRSTSFPPPTHKGPNENSLICNTPRVGSGL